MTRFRICLAPLVVAFLIVGRAVLKACSSSNKGIGLPAPREYSVTSWAAASLGGRPCSVG
jgi:hypothetical protein